MVVSATACSSRRIASAWATTSEVRPTDGPLGQLHHDEEGALVVLRQEAGGRDLGELDRAAGGRERQHEADDREADDARDRRAVAVAHPVDRAHDEAHDAAARAVVRAAAARRRARARASAR